MMTQVDLCLHRECTDTSDKNYVKKNEWNTVTAAITITVYSKFYPANSAKCHLFLCWVYWDSSWMSKNRNLPTFQRFSRTYFAFSWDFEMCFVILSELVMSTCRFKFPLYYSIYSVIHEICSSFISSFLLCSKRQLPHPLHESHFCSHCISLCYAFLEWSFMCFFMKELTNILK